MTFSDYQIFACPFCYLRYKLVRFASFNTFRATFYSDGYVEGGVPDYPTVIRCINGDCGGFFHLNDQPVLAEVSPKSIRNTEWDKACDIGQYKIGIDDLKAALASDCCEGLENEITVRHLLHLRFNDRFRKDALYILPLQDRISYNQNIDQLIELTQNDLTAEGKLRTAELYREKADFSASMEILRSITTEEAYETVLKEKIFSQCKQKDPVVSNISAVAVKKEFRCDRCADQFIPFDLDKMDNALEYRHYQCLPENRPFTSASRIRNPQEYYRTTIWQRMFTSRKPYKDFITKDSIDCPTCGSPETKAFSPHRSDCLKCKKGKYKEVIWF